MKIRRLCLENYRRHRFVDLEFPDGVMAIVGPNGSGKSSLLEAIGFALFGTQATRTPKALLRHVDAAPSDPVRVTATMELGGQALEVVREFRGLNLTAHATLTIDGRPLVASGANSHGAVTQEVERLLGMDRTAFFTSIVAQQKELSRLADLKPADRKQMILRLLGVDAIDRAIDEGRAKRRQSEQRLQDLRESQPDLKAIRNAASEATAQAKAARQAHATAEAAWVKQQDQLTKADKAFRAAEAADRTRRDAAQAVQAASASNASLLRTQAELQERVEAAKVAASEAATLAPEAAKRPEAAKALAQARKQRTEAAAAMQARVDADRLRSELAALPSMETPEDPTSARHDLEQTRQRIQELERKKAAAGAVLSQCQAHTEKLASADAHAPCPFCEQPLDEALPALQRRIEAELAQAQEALAALDQALAQARTREQDQSQRLSDLEAAQEVWQQHTQQRTILQARLDDLLPRCVDVPAPDMAPLERALAAAEQAEQGLIRAQTRAESLAADEARLTEVEQQLQRAQKALCDAEAHLAALPEVDVEGPRTALQAAQAGERAAERAVHEAAAAVQLADQERDHRQAQLEAAKQAQERIRGVEQELRLWTALAGGRNRGLLESFRTHMVGKIRPAINAEASRLLARFTEGRYRELLLDDEYGVFVVDEGVPYTLDRFSGGESDLAHLALRLAVSRLLTQRSGAPELRFLALDEVFGSLDRHRRDAVLSALHSLDDLYSQVVLVTHQEGLHEALDAVLEVRSDGDASQVRFHQG